MTDNCSIDNNEVLDMWCVLTEAREIDLANSYAANARTTGAWCFFGRSISAGKKNDHKFHNKIMDHVMKEDNEKETL